MEKYDIYYAKFFFEDNPEEYKIRPVLMLGENEALTFGAKITSHKERENLDYSIKDWKQAGLKKESVVRLNKIQNINPLKYVGHLSDRDIENIENILNK